MSVIFGLDFGTTNSALSVSYGGKTEVIDIGEYNENGKTLRSVLYFDEERNVFVGQEAINQYIHNMATGRFMQSIKSFLPSKQFDYTYINGKRYELEDLIAIILRRIKEKGEKYVGQKVTKIVMGRPVVFSEDKEKDTLAQERLRSAAIKVGFKEIFFQFEPVAAALSFRETLKSEEEKIVLIGDFGGGTSDFTAIKLKGGLSASLIRSSEILSLGGVYIGGDKFDSELMWRKISKYFGRNVSFKSMTNQNLPMPTAIIGKLKQWHLIPQLRDRKIIEQMGQIRQTADNKGAVSNLINLIEDNFGFILFQSIEKAKIELSSLKKSRIVFSERNLKIKEDITREEFDSIIYADAKKIKDCINKVLSDASLMEGDVDIVFLTGGSSRVPLIRKIFTDKFSDDKIREMDAFTSVVYGLGLSSNMYF